MEVFLFIFAITYLLRWISDAYIVPYIVEHHVDNCTLEGVETFCVKAGFISYYLWTSLIFDLLPLYIIVYFHHKSFRNQDKLDLYSQSAVSERTQQDYNENVQSGVEENVSSVSFYIDEH